jgi:mannose-6-phosphate isomerase-like protein (cupin superfamily)
MPNLAATAGGVWHAATGGDRLRGIGRLRGDTVQVRRVVTGQDPQGRAVFVSDEVVEPVTVSLLPGAAFHQVWAADEVQALPADGARPASAGYFPPPNGFRFGFFTLGPESVTLPDDLDIGAAIAELSTKLPGLGDVMEPDQPGMHTTDTIDYGVVVEGEVWLELDDGEERLLRRGDCYIQNGTRHRWSNTGDIPAVLAVSIVGAHHDKVG